jgi:hypothetical protein
VTGSGGDGKWGFGGLGVWGLRGCLAGGMLVIWWRVGDGFATCLLMYRDLFGRGLIWGFLGSLGWEIPDKSIRG